jgi:hypothetical protein
MERRLPSTATSAKHNDSATGLHQIEVLLECGWEVMKMTTVTVTLQDDVYRRASQFAQLANLNVNEVLSDAIEMSLPPPGSWTTAVKPVSDLSDKEVLKLTELQMTPAQDRRLSRLLNRQQAGKLKADNRAELISLMQVYQDGLLRKAQALAEAVRRGLREPLTP